MYTFATIAIIAALTLAVTRAVRGPTIFDRILAGNTVGTLAILLLIAIGFLFGRPEWLDIALTYAFLNLIATLTILKYVRYDDLEYDSSEEGPKS
ncbi:MAG: monovalent cation/H+ antiporter complex subunit F [Pseudomonadota bacterium]